MQVVINLKTYLLLHLWDYMFQIWSMGFQNGIELELVYNF